MYNSVQLAFKYLQYYFTASNGKGHGLHSPFVFDFIIHVLNDRKTCPAYNKVEELREQLLSVNQEIEVEDFGAGSSIDKTNKRRIASIARHAAKPKKYGQLLYRMVQYYKSSAILELGTSLGITTSYLALANPLAKIMTIEGSPSIASIAKRNFNSLSIENTKIVEGNFDSVLSQVINNFSSIDFIFIDGNHREEPTIRYFNKIIGKTKKNSIVVLDDIHWSKEMEGAWQTIKNHSLVKCTIDLFFMGIVFFRDEFHEKQHFTVRF